MSESEENRAHPRKPIELKVEYKRLNAFFADYTRNISHGGTFIKTDKPLPIGTEFVFKLIVPKLEEAVSIQGEVRWLGDPQEGEEAGMGIGFVYREESERLKVQELVEELMVESLGRLLTSKLMNHGRDEESEE